MAENIYNISFSLFKTLIFCLRSVSCGSSAPSSTVNLDSFVIERALNLGTSSGKTVFCIYVCTTQFGIKNSLFY